MLRKLAVLIVAAVVVDPYLQVHDTRAAVHGLRPALTFLSACLRQIIAALLVVNLALLLHVRFEPYDRAELNNLETGALVAVLVTQVRAGLHRASSPSCPVGGVR